MKFLVPLQNFIEESNFFFAIAPATGSVSRNPINTAPVTVDYKTSRKTTPKTTTRGQNIAVSPVIITSTTKAVSSTIQSRDNQTTAFPTEADAVTTQASAFPTKAAAAEITTSGAGRTTGAETTAGTGTAFPTKAAAVGTTRAGAETRAGDGSFGTTSGGTDGTMTTGNGDWDLILSELIPTKSG